jgi:glycosyltransferase involved in cell wall biosynthesis
MPSTFEPSSVAYGRQDGLAKDREIWIVQRYLAHYRLPVFDRLARKLGERGCTLRVVFDRTKLEGPADPSRAYCETLIRLNEFRPFGIEFCTQTGLVPAIRRRRPAGVIVEGSIRVLTNLRVPSAVRSSGGVALMWSKGEPEKDSPRGSVSNFIRSRFVGLFDGVICYGEGGRRSLEALGVPASRITIAPNTIDTRRIFASLADRDAQAAELRTKHGLKGRRIVLCCGTMYRKKRPLDLIEAWPAIQSAHPDAVLVLVGTGEMFEAARGRVAELGVGDVLLTGRVPEGEDYAWIGACDVSVMCGGLGLAIQQTLAFGKPMVVADEPGVDGEIIRHRDTGWRYPLGDVPALARTVKSVLSDPEGSAAVARRGQDLIRNHVNIDGMVDGFLTALERAGALPRK